MRQPMGCKPHVLGSCTSPAPQDAVLLLPFCGAREGLSSQTGFMSDAISSCITSSPTLGSCVCMEQGAGAEPGLCVHGAGDACGGFALISGQELLSTPVLCSVGSHKRTLKPVIDGRLVALMHDVVTWLL